jgi:hypothetical protein
VLEPDEEEFDHVADAWTVGQLRAALEGVPDDLPIEVITAEEPGSNMAGPDQVVIGAGPWVDVDTGPTGSAGRICMPGATAADVRAKLDAGELQPDHFEISLEFPSGRYYRRKRP